MSASRTTPALFACALGLASAASALEQASGVNLTADEGFGARHLGMAITRAGFAQGADAVVNAPASMNDVNDFTFTTAHAEQFGMARFDNAAVLIPWHAQSTLGFGFSRYAVSGVELREETVGQPSADPDGLFSTADWVMTGAFARRFHTGAGSVDLGGSVHLLQRHLDQNGIGMRGDAMLQYTRYDRLRMGTYVRGLVPSMARWESGYTEYEAPEAVLFAAMRKDVPYFYGSLQAGVETPGILQPGARSASRLEGDRGVTDPLSVLKTTKIGAEFNFNFGLSLRAGLDELQDVSALRSIDMPASLRLGMGYNWRRIVAIDYAFAAHPFFDESHRIALRFTPSFPRFEGRSFRPRDTRTVPRETLRPTYPSPYVPGDRDGSSKADGDPLKAREDSGSTGGSRREVLENPAPVREILEEPLEDGEILEILE